MATAPPASLLREGSGTKRRVGWRPIPRPSRTRTTPRCARRLLRRAAACDSAMTIVSRFEFSVSATVNPDCTVRPAPRLSARRRRPRVEPRQRCEHDLDDVHAGRKATRSRSTPGRAAALPWRCASSRARPAPKRCRMGLTATCERSQLWGNGLRARARLPPRARIQTSYSNTVYGTLPAQRFRASASTVMS